MKFQLNVALSAVTPGQKNGQASVEPTLIAKSTDGGFQLTPAVTKALGLKAGDTVFFANNIAGVRGVVEAKTEEVISIAAELGVDINTVEGANAVVDACTRYYIGKGYQQFDKYGNPAKATLRMSVADKEKFIKEHTAEIIAANRDELIKRAGDPNASDEVLAAQISVEDIPSPEIDAYFGSRTSNPSGMTNVGATLHFTDNYMWNTLKADLEDKKSKNRKFKVDLTSPVEYPADNGKEKIVVNVYPFEFDEDVDPMRRTKADEQSGDATSAE